MSAASMGILRPAERRGLERLANLGAGLAGADGGDDLLADGMFLRGVGVPGGLERVVGAVAGALEHEFPRVGIAFLEAREEADERLVGRVANLILKGEPDDLVAAALENLGVGDDFLDEAVARRNGGGPCGSPCSVSPPGPRAWRDCPAS
jgi:hypothetical protein